MTAIVIAGAASHEAMNWPAIDWHKAHRNVRRHQARIVKACQEGRWGKVKALQHLLTHSFSGRAIAVRRVTENPGKRTPGLMERYGIPRQRKRRRSMRCGIGVIEPHRCDVFTS